MYLGKASLPARLFQGFCVLAAMACIAMACGQAFTQGMPFTPDSCVYADVAHHVAAGEGLQRGVLMAFQPRHLAYGECTVPLTLYAPLYPLFVGALIALGMPAPAAALTISVFFFAITVLLLGLLARQLFGPAAGLLSVALALHCWPLRYAGGHAWSETLAMALLLAGFLAAVRASNRGHAVWFWAFLGGFGLGLAFATRYALLPAGVLTGAALLMSRRFRAACFFAVGFAIPAIIIITRNMAILGRPLGAARDPSTLGISENLRHAFISVFQMWMDPALLGAGNQLRLLLAVLTVAVGVAILAKRWTVIHAQCFRFAPALLAAWAVGYVLFLILYRSVADFDPIGPRLVLPGLIAVLPLAAGALTIVAGAAPIRALTVLLLLLAMGREAHLLHAGHAPGYRVHAATSERLRWVRENTTPDDLLMGDRNYDLPLFCGLRKGLCFFPSEEPRHHLTPHVIRAYLAPRLGKFDRCFIVLNKVFRDEPVFEEEWRRACGGLVADMVFGKASHWPGITEVARLRDGYVFALDPRTFLGDRVEESPAY